jgi:hypothetical protein
VLDPRGRLLHDALGFVTLRTAPRHPALDALHLYLDSWRGVGATAVGMAHQDFDLQVMRGLGTRRSSCSVATNHHCAYIPPAA